MRCYLYWGYRFWEKLEYMIVENSYFYNNKAYSGGAMGSTDNNFQLLLEINNCIFINNTAETNGGAISFAHYS